MSRVLINYIKNCLNPVNTTEFVETDVFVRSVYDNLVQDGIYICNVLTDEDKCELSDCIEINNIYIIRKVIKEIEWLNRDGSFSWSTGTMPLYRRLLPPPIETVNHTLIISEILKSYTNTFNSKLIYLEYGVRHGANFNTMVELNSTGVNIGVDIKILPHLSTRYFNDNYQLYEMKTDTFSMTVLPLLKPDVAFIDADHCSESVIKDFTYIFRYLKVGGYIILHDTYPCSPEYLDVNGCSDCYKTPIYIKSKLIPMVDLSILTLPLNPGVTIIKKLR